MLLVISCRFTGPAGNVSAVTQKRLLGKRVLPYCTFLQLFFFSSFPFPFPFRGRHKRVSRLLTFLGANSRVRKCLATETVSVSGSERGLGNRPTEGRRAVSNLLQTGIAGLVQQQVDVDRRAFAIPLQGGALLESLI